MVHFVRRTARASLAVALLVLAACAGPEGRAAKMLDTAAFEERQNNFVYATKLYRRILEEYPETPAAQTAQERLRRIERGEVEER